MEWVQSTDEFFTRVRQAKPVVMIFSAGWCPDCTYLDMFIDEVAEEYKDKFDFFKVNRDDFGDLVETLDIMGIPSFLVYEQGNLIRRFVNGKRKSREEVTAFLDDAIQKTQNP